MKRIMKWFCTGILCIAVLFAFSAATDTTAYAASTKTVYTQAQLTKALKNKSITTIKVSTKKTVTLTIPKGNYSKKSIYVTGSKAKIVTRERLKTLLSIQQSRLCSTVQSQSLL